MKKINLSNSPLFILLIALFLVRCNDSKNSAYYRSYATDSRGFLIGKHPVDKDIISKIGCYHFTYNSDGLVTKIEFFYRNKPAINEKKDLYNVSKVLISYENGNEKRNFQDSESKLTINKDYVYMELIERDHKKHAKAKSFFDEENKAISNRFGVYKYIYETDDKGRIITVLNYDEHKKPIADNERVLKTYKRYDEKDNLCFVNQVFININDNDVFKKYYKYDSDGNLISGKDYNFKNLPISMNNKNDNIFYSVIKYDKDGNVVEIKLFDKNDELTETKEGISIYRYKYNKYFEEIERKLFNKKNDLVDVDGVAIFKSKYNDDNFLIETSYYNSKKEKSSYKHNIFKFVWDVDSIGLLTDEKYFDIQEKEIAKKEELITDYAEKCAKNWLMSGFLKSKNINDSASILKSYNYAINLNPYDKEAYKLRASFYESINDIDKALTDFQKSIEIDETNAEAYSRIGNIYFNNKQDNQNALKYYNTAIELDGRQYRSMFYRGLIKLKFNDFQGSLSDLFRILNENTFNQDGNSFTFIKDMPDGNELIADTYYLIGINYYNMNQYNNAIKYLTSSIYPRSQNELNSNVYYYRGLCYYNIGQKVKACSDLSKAGELGNQDAYKAINMVCN